VGKIPALRVSNHKPSHVLAKVIIAIRPQQQMPMIWHETKRQHSHGHSLAGLLQHARKSIVIGIVVKDLAARRRTI
jgi:hypothetical protein